MLGVVPPQSIRLQAQGVGLGPKLDVFFPEFIAHSAQLRVLLSDGGFQGNLDGVLSLPYLGADVLEVVVVRRRFHTAPAIGVGIQALGAAGNAIDGLAVSRLTRPSGRFVGQLKNAGGRLQELPLGRHEALLQIPQF